MNYENSWSDELAPHLPRLDEPFILHHIAATPQKQALMEDAQRSKNGKQNQLVPAQLSTHFLTLTHAGVHVLALELLVFSSSPSAQLSKMEHDPLTTIFVSKADSSGYFNSGQEDANLSLGAIVTQILRVFIKTLSRPNIPTRLCLFARAQSQYIFPESGRNKRKHVLSDRDLIKWWIRVTTPLLAVFSELKSARLSIPGAEQSEINSYLPPDPDAKTVLWQEGHIFCTDGDRDKDLALRHVPSFPDDPKSRFLDVVVAEGRGGIMTVNQFFAELQMRQEFLSGFVAAIIGVEGLVEKTANEPTHFTCPVVDIRAYSRIHDAIVTSDYSTEKMARNATAKFIEALPKSSEHIIRGTQAISKVRRKHDAHLTKPSHQINIIGGGLVRKRTKSTHTKTAFEQQQDVNKMDRDSDDREASKKVKL
ncbi:histone H3-K56 acetyltransferase [Lipomyces kononenkoae]|uniref:Histone H3-K56 acetyltransferase n=1 Tax=Lipomyces kononenkoae TaxID=34357 RepID=A0ACC3T9I8_LIPKO